MSESHLTPGHPDRERALLHRAIEALDVGFVMFDEQDRLVVCNQKFREIYAPIAALLVPGRPMRDVLLAGHRNGMVDNPQGLDAQAWLDGVHEDFFSGAGGTRTLDMRIGERWYRVENTRTADGLTVGLRTDITASRRLTEELTRARDAAQAADRSKSEFLANMSHEWRTPIHAILGMTELTLDTQLAPGQRDCLERVKDAAQVLRSMVDDILELARADNETLALQTAAFSLRDLLRSCCDPIATKAAAKGLDWNSFVQDDAPDDWVGDRQRLRQVLMHLLENALKFTRRGALSLRTSWLEGSAAGDRLRFVIEDTGVGIAADRLPAIFDAFAQADGSDTRAFGGAGVGLALSRRLAERMKGSITVQSEPQRGSRFEFEVPLQRAPSGASTADSVVANQAGPVDLDLDEALERLDGDRELLRELIEVFLGDLPSQLQAIEAALAQGDPAALVAPAHSISGSAGNLSALAIHEVAERLVQAGRAANLSGVEALVQGLPVRAQALRCRLAELASG